MKHSIKFLGVSLVVAFALAISACTLVEKDEEEKNSRREQTETRDTTKESTSKAPETTPTTIDTNTGSSVTSAWNYDGEDDLVEVIDYETEDARIKYLSYEIIKSRDGEPAIRIFLEFENKTEGTTMSYLYANIPVYGKQNGEMLDNRFYMIDEDIIDEDYNLGDEIGPGEKIIFTKRYLLYDTTSTLELIAFESVPIEIENHVAVEITNDDLSNLQDGQIMLLPIS